MIDFQKISKTLVDEIKPQLGSKEIATFQYACIPLVIEALKLYNEELSKESSNP